MRTTEQVLYLSKLSIEWKLSKFGTVLLHFKTFFTRCTTDSKFIIRSVLVYTTSHIFKNYVGLRP